MSDSTDQWGITKGRYAVGTWANCVVKSHQPFGFLVTIEDTEAVGIVERIRMNQDGYNTPADYPPIGSLVKLVVLGFRDYNNEIEFVMPNKNGDIPVQVGLRIGEDGELAFLGIDVVNQMLKDGASVSRIEPGHAKMWKTSESCDAVKLQLRGFFVRVIVSAKRSDFRPVPKV